MNGRKKFILCLAKNKAALCQVVEQKGTSFIITAQSGFCDERINVFLRLSKLLKDFDPQHLRQVKDIVISPNFFRFTPLDIFYQRDENFDRAAIFEFENILGEKAANEKFGLYRVDEEHGVGAFSIDNALQNQLNELLDRFDISKPNMYVSSVMFIEGAKRHFSKNKAFYINFEDENLLSLVGANGDVKKSSIMKMAVDKLLQRLSLASGKKVKIADLESSEKNDEGTSAQQKKIFDEFILEICGKIQEYEKTWFKDDDSHSMIFSGEGVIADAIRAVYPQRDLFISLRDFFKQQISPSIDPKVQKIFSEFIPAVLSFGLIGNQQLSRLVNLKNDHLMRVKRKRKSTFVYGKFWSIVISVFCGLFWAQRTIEYHQEKINFEKKTLSDERAKLKGLSLKIESTKSKIQQQDKILKDVRVSVLQNQAWISFFNDLQFIFSAIDNVYLNSLIYDPEESPQKSDSKSKNKKEKEPASIKLEGTMFVENMEIAGNTKDEFNEKFNTIFSKIKQMPVCSELTDIKVNTPQGNKITFRCVISVSPSSNIIATL